MKKLILSVLVAALCAGCATTDLVKQLRADPELSFLDAFVNVTEADIDAAMANVDDDPEAEVCYPALKKFVGEIRQRGGREIKGPISANQIKRNLLKGGGLPPYLKILCAAYLQDEREFLLKLGAIAGSKGAIGGGSLPFFSSAHTPSNLGLIRPVAETASRP